MAELGATMGAPTTRIHRITVVALDRTRRGAIAAPLSTGANRGPCRPCAGSHNGERVQTRGVHGVQEEST
jgi:hypothetical protein